jgi:hypothetical protein
MQAIMRLFACNQRPAHKNQKHNNVYVLFYSEFATGSIARGVQFPQAFLCELILTD